MKNKIILIKESDFTFDNEVLIFANERDIKQHFDDLAVEIYETHVIVQKCGFKDRYKLLWAKDFS